MACGLVPSPDEWTLRDDQKANLHPTSNCPYPTLARPSDEMAHQNFITSPLHASQVIRHNRATTATKPPSIPAPIPAAFVGPAFGVEEVGALEEVPVTVLLATVAVAEADVDRVLPLDVVAVAAPLLVEVPVPVGKPLVAVDAQDTAEGRVVTPFALHKS